MSDSLQRIGVLTGSQGAATPFTADSTSAQRVADAHGRYTEASFGKRVFSGSVVGQVTTVGTATTYTGLCLSNPVGSNVVLSVNKVGYAFVVAFAAGSVIGLMTGYHAATNVTHTTPVTPRSQFFTGNAGGVGLLDSAATLPATPTLNQILGSGLTGAITTAVHIPTVFDVDGAILLPPGGFCAFYTSTASGAAAGAFSFQWEEIPVAVYP